MFPDYKIVKSTSARVIRDSDFEIQEEAEDLVLYLEQALKKRKRGRIVKLEIRSNIDEDLRKFIVKNLEVKKDQIYEIDSFVGSHQIDEIYNKGNSNYIFKPFNPRPLERLKQHNNNYFDAIKTKDFIVHHPYETFDSVIQFLNQAAQDSNVIAIKQSHSSSFLYSRKRSVRERILPIARFYSNQLLLFYNKFYFSINN